MRDIARAAGVSLGNIYNYYRTKEQLFASLIRRYEAKTGLMRMELAGLSGTIDDPDNLRRLAAGVRRIVYKEPDYWRLMYMDITEFGNRHFAFVFRDLSRRLQNLLDQPDDKWGEAGIAFVVARPKTPLNAGDLLEFLSARLARYKLPKEIMFLPELPRTPYGKVVKGELRERWQKAGPAGTQ